MVLTPLAVLDLQVPAQQIRWQECLQLGMRACLRRMTQGAMIMSACVLAEN